jgi:hypothetical protein
MKHGCPQVLRKFTASQPSPDEIVSPLSTKRVTFRKTLIGTSENKADDALKTHIFTTLTNSDETTIQIL